MGRRVCAGRGVNASLAVRNEVHRCVRVPLEHGQHLALRCLCRNSRAMCKLMSIVRIEHTCTSVKAAAASWKCLTQ